MRKNHALESEMLGHIKEWQYSGQSQKSYCQEQGISFCKFNYWVRKSRPASVTGPGFVAIQLEKPPGAVSASPIMELVSITGTRLSFYSPVDPEFIKRLL